MILLAGANKSLFDTDFLTGKAIICCTRGDFTHMDVVVQFVFIANAANVFHRVEESVESEPFKFTLCISLKLVYNACMYYRQNNMFNNNCVCMFT